MAVLDEARLAALLSVAEPLAREPPRALILARVVQEASELGPAAAWLDERRAGIEARGRVARAASFTSDEPGEELARLASELDVDLLLADAPAELLADGVPGEQLATVLADAPCDVALLVAREARGRVLSSSPSAAPSTTGRRWSSAPGSRGPRASRSSSRARPPRRSRASGTRAACSRMRRSPSSVCSASRLSRCSIPPGEEGMLEASRDAGVLVVGLSERWHREGLGAARLRLAKEAGAPTLLVRRGLRPGGLAPPATLTHFTWSMRA